MPFEGSECCHSCAGKHLYFRMDREPSGPVAMAFVEGRPYGSVGAGHEYIDVPLKRLKRCYCGTRLHVRFVGDGRPSSPPATIVLKECQPDVAFSVYNIKVYMPLEW